MRPVGRTFVPMAMRVSPPAMQDGDRQSASARPNSVSRANAARKARLAPDEPSAPHYSAPHAERSGGGRRFCDRRLAHAQWHFTVRLRSQGVQPRRFRSIREKLGEECRGMDRDPVSARVRPRRVCRSRSLLGCMPRWQPLPEMPVRRCGRSCGAACLEQV